MTDIDTALAAYHAASEGDLEDAAEDLRKAYQAALDQANARAEKAEGELAIAKAAHGQATDLLGLQAKRAEKAEAERDAARTVITDAALETYTPEGAEVVANQVIKQQQELTTLRAMVAKVRELADEWVSAPPFMAFSGPCLTTTNNHGHDLLAALDGTDTGRQG